MQPGGGSSQVTKEGAHTAILTSALVVGSTYAIRKLIEPAASEARHPAKTLGEGVLQVAGAEPAPANVAQFATGFGFVFTSLAVVATFAPSLAGSMAVLTAVSNTIINGGAIFADVSRQVAGTPAAAAGTPAAAITGTVASGRQGTAKVGASTVRITNTGQLH